jgi:hypothetical protein
MNSPRESSRGLSVPSPDLSSARSHRPSRASSRGPSCADCGHFNRRPLDIEAALPGLSSLSSAFAAVRSDDGICAVHDRYVTASSVCAAHAGVAIAEAGVTPDSAVAAAAQ